MGKYFYVIFARYYLQISSNVASILMAVLTFAPTQLAPIDVAVGLDTDWLPMNIPVKVGTICNLNIF